MVLVDLVGLGRGNNFRALPHELIISIPLSRFRLFPFPLRYLECTGVF